MTPNRSDRYWHYLYLTCGIVAMLVVIIGARSLDRRYAIILSGVTLMVFVGLDLYHTLRTGRAWGRHWGTITKQKRPGLYWRYVYASYAVVAVCVVLLMWAVAYV